MDSIQQCPVNPNDMRLYEDLNAEPSSQISVEEDKENVGYPIETYVTENKPSGLIHTSQMGQYWEEVSPDVRYQQPAEGTIWEQVIANQYQMQPNAGPSQDYQQHYSFQQAPPPPPHQMLLQHLSAERTDIVHSDSVAERAPRRKIGENGKLGFAWTYPAMIAAALLNSPGPQKMERLYAFMETHFIARLVKKENGSNDKHGWRKCIRHTVAYGKQFQSFAPANMARGKLYSLNPEKLAEVHQMLRNKYDTLREDMAHPELLEAMLAGELRLPSPSDSEQSVVVAANDKPIRQRRKRGPYGKNKTTNEVTEEQVDQPVAQYPWLSSYLSAPPQIPPYWMGQYNPHGQSGYPFNGYPFGQNYGGYARDTTTPGSLSTHSATDGSEVGDLDRVQYDSASASPSTSGLHYQNYPVYTEQFPDEFLQV